MKISRIRDVKLPTRGTQFSAGLDFYVPEFSEKFVSDLLNLEANKRRYEITRSSDGGIFLFHADKILIPSGIKVKIPEGNALIAFNKSGISTKKGLDVLACIIDEDFQGEIHLSVVNVSHDIVQIKFGEKLVQFLLLQVFYPKIEEVPIEKLYDEKTKRAEGGFGSTGDK